MDFKRILVPVDFSDTSRRAVEAGLELARKFHGEVTLFHSFEMPIYPVPDGAYLTAGTIDEIEAQIHQTLSEWRRAYQKKGRVRVHMQYSMGVAHLEIVEAARKGRFQLLVLGTHGRTGIRHAVLGSVAERVVRLAPCPVLTVRPGVVTAKIPRAGRRRAKSRR